MPVLSTLGAAIANVYGFTSGLIKDQYFNLVSLLLPGNGTNGANNNTFLDSSGQNGGAGWTITRNPTSGPNAPTQGTFSPFSQTGWGAYFDGSNDYLSIANNSAFNISSGDFTLETWINLNSFPSAGNTEGLVCIANTSIVNYSSVTIRIFIKSDGKIQIDAGSSSTGTSTPLFDITSANAISLNTFTHIAFARSGSTFVLYINGKAEATTTTSATLYWDASKVFHIAADGGGTRIADGYFSNLRLVTSQALFTGSTLGTTYFTPSIQPLTTSSIGATGSGVAASLTGTVALLTCQANRFRDASSSNLTITANNGAAITPFSPFAPTQSYSAAAVGGSGYFDGTGDYLQVAANTNLNFGTGNFTVEGWVYTASTGTIYFAIGDATGDASFGYEGGNFIIGRRGIGNDVSTSSFTMPQNQWAHVVYTRAGTGTNQTRIFVNGVLRGVGTTSQSYNFTTNVNIVGGTFGSWPGYFTNLRFVKGSVVSAYSTSSTTVGDVIFTPPTAPLTAITDTQLLLNFVNAGVVDATAKNVLETVGNAQISTSVSKFGGGSISFDGNGDYLLFPASNLYRFGTGPLTVEFWFYPLSSLTNAGIVDMRASSASNTGLLIRQGDGSSSGTVIYCWLGNPGSTTAATQTGLNINQWNHIAVVRDNSNNLTVYVNGSGGTPVARSIDLTDTNCLVGAFDGATSSPNAINGYIDDLRISRMARYTANFTAPSAPFPVQ